MAKSNLPIATERTAKDIPSQIVPYSMNVFGSRLLETTQGDDIAAVHREAPRDIYYDPEAIKSIPRYGIAHEMEHVLDNRAKDRYGPEWNKSEALREAYTTAGGKDRDFIRNMRNTMATPEVRERFKALGFKDGYVRAKVGKDIWDIPTNNAPIHEIMASLSGYEQANNVQLTKDPVLSKSMFQDPALVAAYNASTGLRTERLDARDLAPYTPVQPPSAWDNFASSAKRLGAPLIDAINKYGGR